MQIIALINQKGRVEKTTCEYYQKYGKNKELVIN